MSESSRHPYGGRNERPDDEQSLPGEHPVDEEEQEIEAPDKKRDDEFASRAAEEGTMDGQGDDIGPSPGIPHRTEAPSPADATEGDPPGGSVANQRGRAPDQ